MSSPQPVPSPLHAPVRPDVVAVRSWAHGRRLRRDVARLRAALAALEAGLDAGPDAGADAAAAPVTAVLVGWLAARDRLDQLATLRGDVAEALHHVRAALDPPPR